MVLLSIYMWMWEDIFFYIRKVRFVKEKDMLLILDNLVYFNEFCYEVFILEERLLSYDKIMFLMEK